MKTSGRKLRPALRKIADGKASLNYAGSRLARYVLFSNGVADILAALALFCPVLGIPLPFP